MAMDEKMNKATIMLVIGIMLVGVNATIVTSTFDGLISQGMADNVAAAYEQDVLIDEDWNESTSEKVYFGYNLTDVDALSSEDPSNAYTKVGPWIYNVTSHKELLDWNEDEGTMTYSEYEVFEWCGDCTWEDRDGTMGEVGQIYDSVPGTNDFKNVNILWTAQSIGAIGPVGFDYGEPFAKAGFATNMMTLELSSKAPSIWSAEDTEDSIAEASAGLLAAGMDSASANAAAPGYVMSVAYSSWNASSEAGIMTPDFTSSANTILNDAVDPSTGICIALTCDYGHMLVAGMGEPSESVTPMRAMLYGYGDITEPERTHIDWAVYALAGNNFQGHGGGADLTTVDNNRERLLEVSGVNIGNPDALEHVLFGIGETGLAEGIIQETDFNGLPLNGNILFLLGASANPFEAMSTYGIGLSQLLGLADYADCWLGSGLLCSNVEEFPMILVGESGTMNSDEWWIESFGGEEPLQGGYIPLGLNMGPFEGLIDMSPEDVRRLLYDGEYAMCGPDPDLAACTTEFGSEFMYGEASGKTLPQGSDGAETGGEVFDWNDEYVANLYGISELEAQAFRSYIKNFMVDVVVPTLLTFQTGAEAYTTQTVDQWLFGSCDAVLEFQFGAENCFSSLETNKTYYGSISEDHPEGMSTGDYSAYVMSIEGDTIGQRLMQGYVNTDGDGFCDFDYSASGVYLGEDIECTEGQVYGMTEYLTWRAPAKDAANFGLMEEAVGSSVDYAVLENSIGAIGDSDNSFKYNLGGYAVAMTEVGDEVEFKGIPMVEHSIVLDATQHNIQSKLIPTSLSPISVTPGVLGLYFNGNVDFKVEPNTNAVMYGHGTLQFVLDIRGLGYDSPDLSEGATDAYPVFEIAIHSEIDDEGAEDVRGATDSIGIMGFTNLDAPMPILALNLVQLVVYLLGLGMASYGVMNLRFIIEDE
jgi:hypothetical protein